MANRDGYPSHDMSPGRVTIEWWFDTTTAAGTQPTSYAQLGHGIKSISKSGAGTYVITLEDNWVVCQQAGANLANPVGTFNYASCTQPDVGQVASTKQFTVQTILANGSAVVDPASPVRCYVNLVMSNTTARA